MTSTATFSSLLRHPHEVIDKLGSGDVVLTRRDGEPLRLSLDHDATRDHDMMLALARLLGPVIEASRTDLLDDVLPVSFPWIDFLPADSRREFVTDFVRTAAASASVGRLDRLGIVVAGWRETALAYSLGLDQANADLDRLSEPVPVADPRGL